MAFGIEVRAQSWDKEISQKLLFIVPRLDTIRTIL
jgi:hypothetical protein